MSVKSRRDEPPCFCEIFCGFRGLFSKKAQDKAEAINVHVDGFGWVASASWWLNTVTGKTFD